MEATKTTIYAGDLDPEVTEEDLIEAFRFIGPIASVRLCRDSLTGNSLRYAYINFFSFSHALKAKACMNHTELKGKPMRLMWSQRDSIMRKTGIGNVFVKNLDSSITSAQLQEMFAAFGNILSFKVAEENGASKGFGFVQFDSEESAAKAIDSLHDSEVLGKNLFVSKFVRKTERMAILNAKMTFTNLFVKNLDEHITEEALEKAFSRLGKVSSVAIIKDDAGKSKGFGFVNFESPESARNAIALLNASQLGSKTMFVERARQKDGKNPENIKTTVLYVRNIDASVDHKQLKQHFKGCGEIVFVRISRRRNGDRNGFGFVCFSTHEEANKALKTMNGSVLAGRSLTLALDRHENQLPNSTASSSSSSFTVPVPVPQAYHYQYPSSEAIFNQPFLYVNGGCYGPYMAQNFSHRYTRTLPTSEMQMGRRSEQSPTLSY